MLPPAHRLTDAASFRDATRRGRRASTRTLVAHLRTPAIDDDPTLAPTDAPVRVGFVVSKAVGGSVVRHRVQRRLRHATRDRLGALPDRGVLVVRALPASAAASYAELDRDLARCLARLCDAGEVR